MAQKLRFRYLVDVLDGIRGQYLEVHPYLYQGTMPTRHQGSFYDPFDHIVVCTDPEYAHLWTFLPTNGKYTDIAQFDYSDDGILALLKQAEMAADSVRSSRRVLVMCSSGIYRSSLFCSLVRTYLGTPLDVVLANMVSSQPGWSHGSANIFADSIRKHLKDKS